MTDGRNFAMFDAGFGNMVPKTKVIGLLAYDSDPIHRHCQELDKMHRVIDATKGRKVKTVIFLDSSHIVLSAVARETLCERIAGEKIEIENTLSL